MKLTAIFMLTAALGLAAFPHPFGGSETSTPKTPLRYKYSYIFQMEMKGNIAFFIPYRFYHEASAAVFCTCSQGENGTNEFRYDGIDTPGYVMSTGGRTGNSLWFFTADTDPRRAETFREQKISLFKKDYPYFGQQIRLIRRKPMTILSHETDSVSFRRNAAGVHSEIHTHMRLSAPLTKTYSNIYEILGKTLAFYNHSFLPEGGWPTVEDKNTASWNGAFLDLAAPLNETVRLTSEYAEENANFRQKIKFRLRYRVMDNSDSYIDIRGVAEPDLNVWKDMRLRLVTREIRVRKTDKMLIHDIIVVDFQEKKNKGGMISMNLAVAE